MKNRIQKTVLSVAVAMMPHLSIASEIQLNSEQENWEALTPQKDSYDWLQMNSGEWLKGKLKSIQNDKVEFDSDEFDLQKVDFEDVKQLRCSGISTIHGDKIGNVVGRVMIRDQKIIVVTDEGEKTFRLDQVTSVLEGADQESNYWSAKVTINLNVRSGNTDQIDYGAKVNVKRQTVQTRFIVDYLGSLSSTSGTETANSQRVNSTFDVFQTRRLFWQPFIGEYYRDPFLNINSRYTLGVGAGYVLIDSAKTDWSINGGPTYQITEFDTVEAGNEDEVSTATLLLGTKFNTEIGKSTDFIYEYSFNILDEASGLYTHHMIATFENEFVTDFDFDISLVWDRVEKPAKKADGSVPEQDDFRLLVGVGYSY